MARRPMQHDTHRCSTLNQGRGAFRTLPEPPGLSEMHIRGTRNDESLVSWPFANPKADASAQGFGDHHRTPFGAVAIKNRHAAWPRAGPITPRRTRPRRANDAVPSRRRRAAPRVLEIATSAPPDPFLALERAGARQESDPTASPLLTSCQRAGRRPDLRVVPPPSALVQFLPLETRQEMRDRPRSAADICVGVR